MTNEGQRDPRRDDAVRDAADAMGKDDGHGCRVSASILGTSAVRVHSLDLVEAALTIEVIAGARHQGCSGSSPLSMPFQIRSRTKCDDLIEPAAADRIGSELPVDRQHRRAVRRRPDELGDEARVASTNQAGAASRPVR